jgi:hypothetical protein
MVVFPTVSVMIPCACRTKRRRHRRSKAPNNQRKRKRKTEPRYGCLFSCRFITMIPWACRLKGRGFEDLKALSDSPPHPLWWDVLGVGRLIQGQKLVVSASSDYDLADETSPRCSFKI